MEKTQALPVVSDDCMCVGLHQRLLLFLSPTLSEYCLLLSWSSLPVRQHLAAACGHIEDQGGYQVFISHCKNMSDVVGEWTRQAKVLLRIGYSCECVLLYSQVDWLTEKWLEGDPRHQNVVRVCRTQCSNSSRKLSIPQTLRGPGDPETPRSTRVWFALRVI